MNTHRNRAKARAFSRLAGAAVLLATLMGCALESDRTIADYEELPDDAYVVIAEIRAKSGKADALRAATLPLVADVRREPNNLLYFLHEDRDAPGHFTFYEIFATEADFEAHRVTPHVQAWFAKLPELADGDVKIRRVDIRGNGQSVDPSG